MLIDRPRLRHMRLAGAVCSAQILIGLVGAGLFGWLDGSRGAAAAFFGAIVAVAPGFWMALWLLPARRSADASSIGRALVWGELGKLGLTAGLFIAAALLFGQQFFALLVTYVASLMCYWLALILTR